MIFLIIELIPLTKPDPQDLLWSEVRQEKNINNKNFAKRCVLCEGQ